MKTQLYVDVKILQRERFLVQLIKELKILIKLNLGQDLEWDLSGHVNILHQK